MIEINNMNSEYVQKAIKILKENCSLSEDDRVNETKKKIDNTHVFIKIRKLKIKIKMAICALSGALSDVLLCGTLLWVAGF